MRFISTIYFIQFNSFSSKYFYLIRELNFQQFVVIYFQFTSSSLTNLNELKKIKFKYFILV